MSQEPPNARMRLTKRGPLLVGWSALAPTAAIFIESRFAAYGRC
jgi:hypothetical protein